MDPDHHLLSAQSRTTHWRAVAKTFSWRGMASLDTFLIGWLITGNAMMGGSIATLEIATKMILYYFHERAWSRVLWGVKPADASAPVAPEGAAAAPRVEPG